MKLVAIFLLLCIPMALGYFLCPLLGDLLGSIAAIAGFWVIVFAVNRIRCINW